MSPLQPPKGPGAQGPGPSRPARHLAAPGFKLVASAETSEILGFGGGHACEIPLEEGETVWIGRCQTLPPPSFRLPAELMRLSSIHCCILYDTARVTLPELTAIAAAIS